MPLFAESTNNNENIIIYKLLSKIILCIYKTAYGILFSGEGMSKKLKIGDLVKINPKNTLFWENSDQNFSPNFENATVPDYSHQLVGMIVGSDFTFVYTQVLSNERVFWVAESSLSAIDI